MNYFRSIVAGLLSFGLPAISYCPKSCHAQNPEFVPGDAFFCSLLNEKFLVDLKDESTVRMAYVMPSELLNFGGYYGFSVLEVSDVPETASAVFQRAYVECSRSRTNGAAKVHDDDLKGEPVQQVPPLLFIYNSDVDAKSVKLGLRFNENWNRFPIEATSEDANRRMLPPPSPYYKPIVFAKYFSFLRTFESVAWDLEGANRYSGLEVVVPPNVSWAIAGPHIETPVVCKYEDVQFVVVADERMLASLFDEEKSAHFFVVRGSTVIRMRYEAGRSGGTELEEYRLD